MAQTPDAPSNSVGPLRGMITPTASGAGIEAPENIVTSIHMARELFYKMRQDHIKRIALHAQIEGLIAGNPPYNPAKLKEAGIGHISNFNTLEARSLYERTALCFWNLVNEAESLIKFEIRYPGEVTEADQVDFVKYADIMAREWTDIVKNQWKGFITQMGTLSSQLVKIGISPLIFPNPKDWRWKVIEYPKFFVPDQTLSDMDQATVMAVESTFTVQYLFEVYERFKNTPAGRCPWDTTELSRLLLHVANSYVKDSHMDIIDYGDIQKRYQNGDLNLDAMYSDSVRVVSLYYKEYTGEVSHYMFHRTFDGGGFIYKAEKEYELGMFEAINIFTISPGEFTIHSNRGLGHKLFSIMQAIMQLDCSIVDMSKWSSTPMLKSTSVGSRDFETIRFIPGVPTNIGTAEFQQNNLGGNITQLVSASQYLSQKAQYNIANSGDDPSMPDRDQGSISPTQAKMRAFKEFSILKNIVAHYYSQLDVVFVNMVSKMLSSKEGYPGYEYCYEWKQRCMDAGVPARIFEGKPPKGFQLPRHIKAKATRVAGDGSTLARLMGLQELTPFLGEFGPKQVREFLRQLITATMGVDQVENFLPANKNADESGGGASLAAVENAVMQMGKSPVFSVDNEQRSHFTTHAALATETIQSVGQQQMDVVEADKIFTVLLPHMGEHYNQLAKSVFNQSYAKQVKKTFDQISQYAKLNRANAEKAIKARIRQQEEDQQATQQVMSEAERADYKTKKDVERADFKVQQQVERAAEANKTRAEVMKSKVESDGENKRLKVQLDHQAKTQANALDSRNKTIENNSIEENRNLLDNMMGKSPSPIDFE